jgi:hypothetical protein
MADAQPLDDATLDELEKAVAGLTPGPWSNGGTRRDCDHSPGVCYFDEEEDIYPPSQEEAGLDYQPGGPVAVVSVKEFPDNAAGICLLRNHASALLHSSREAARLREENRKLRRLCHEATNFVLECRCDSIHLNRDGHDVEVWRDEFAADIRRAALQGEKTDAT